MCLPVHTFWYIFFFLVICLFVLIVVFHVMFSIECDYIACFIIFVYNYVCAFFVSSQSYLHPSPPGDSVPQVPCTPASQNESSSTCSQDRIASDSSHSKPSENAQKESQ